MIRTDVLICLKDTIKYVVYYKTIGNGTGRNWFLSRTEKKEDGSYTSKRYRINGELYREIKDSGSVLRHKKIEEIIERRQRNGNQTE